MMVARGVCLSTVVGPAGRAFYRGDWAFLAGWLSARFGVEVTADWVAVRAGKLILAGKSANRNDWSDGSWAMWWKNRMDEAGMFRPRGPVRGNSFDDYGVPLHVFFLRIEETPEMMARLPEKAAIKSGPATPGIERVFTKPEPIDRVARRVVT